MGDGLWYGTIAEIITTRSTLPLVTTYLLLYMNDKLLHSLSCASITCFTFVVSLLGRKVCSAAANRRCNDDDDIVDDKGRVPCAVDRHCHDDDDNINQRHDHDHDADDYDVEMASSSVLNTHDNEEEEVEQTERIQPHSSCSTTSICIMAVISGIVAMGVGIAKEIFDAYGILWTGGTSSWGDILADFIGVVVGEIFIFVAVILRSLLFFKTTPIL